MTESGQRYGGAAPAWASVAAALAFLLCQFALGDLRSGHLAPGILDPDSYTRLLRVESLLSGGGWYDGAAPWSNAPYGDVLHWTRLYDVLVAAGALPLSQVMSLRAAVWGAGSALPVLLGLATILAVAWAARRRLGAGGIVLLAFLAGAQRTLPMTFKWSSVDHHALLIFLFALCWAGTVRTFDTRQRRGAVVAGVAAGLGLWVSVESLAWILTVAAALSLLWTWEGAETHARNLATLLGTAAATSALALAIERRPTDWLAVEADRISVMQVALVAALAISWALTARKLLPWASGPGRRLAASAASWLVPAAAAGAAFPKLLQGPVADVDPRVIPLLFDFNGEFTSFAAADLLYLAMFAAAVGPALGAVLFCALSFRRADPATRRIAMLTVVLVVVFLALTLSQWRWARYLNVAALLPWALAIRSTWRWRPAGGSAVLRSLRLPAAAALTVGYAVLAVSLALIHVTRARSAAAPSGAPRALEGTSPQRVEKRFAFSPRPCSYEGLGPELAAAAGRKAGELVVMTTLFEGPQLVWESGVRVVGTPYHRNAAGILDTDEVMAQTDEAAARAVLARRDVDFVVVCPTGNSVALLSGIAPGGLAARLARGQIPVWLEPVHAPGAADRSVRISRPSDSSFAP